MAVRSIGMRQATGIHVRADPTFNFEPCRKRGRHYLTWGQGERLAILLASAGAFMCA